ncbi:MAG: dihydroorotate dehydrogenase [Proteobacteria bacterium]|nr:dihydroorotate dehydrogenase [Pseudomonadota bacterium]
MSTQPSPDLSVAVGGLRLKNPVLAASGTFGYGTEYQDLFDPGGLGGVVVKGVSLEPRSGNPPPRICETPAGMLNAIGLQNVGVDRFLAEKLPALRRLDTAVVVNLYATSPDEFGELAGRLAEAPGVDALEVNVSCPNVKAGGLAFGTDPTAVRRVTEAVKTRAGRRPVWVKLTPNTADITLQARAAAEGGADAVSLINTLLGMAVDPDTWRPRLKNVVGGLSGPAVRPVAVRLVYEVCRRVDVDVIGLGGITTARDAIEFLLVGAKAVQVGTAHFVNPRASIGVVEGLRAYLSQRGLGRVTDLVGRLRQD